jgi:hypothetical protein
MQMLIEVEVSNRKREAYDRKRLSFFDFSKLHLMFRLKEDTPFLAFEIFCRIDLHPALSSVPLAALQCTSAFLAMKYQEIYPPSLSTIINCLNWRVDAKNYRALEQTVL